MGLEDLPLTYAEWLPVRNSHLMEDLQKSDYTVDLYKQYKKHLGSVRFLILKESQKLVVPPYVNQLLQLGKINWISPLIAIYKLSRLVKLDGLLKAIILPQNYKRQIRELDVRVT